MYNNFDDYIKEKRDVILHNNVLDVMRNIDNYDDKIIKYIKKYNRKFNVDDLGDLKIKIKNDYMLATIFCKDTSRQNLIENLVYEYIVKELEFGEFNRLSAGGKKSIRFNQYGDIVEDGKKSDGISKSADFSYKDSNNKLWYITQKHTSESGGAQDNQYNDVIDFISKGSIKNNIIAIVDGKYWYKKLDRLKKIMILKILR